MGLRGELGDRLSRKWLQPLGLILGTLLSVVCLWLVFRGARLDAVWHELRGASPFFVGLALLSYALSVWAKAQRWRLLFYPHHRRLRLSKLVSLTLIGGMANIWLFARTGELAKAYLIGEIEGADKALALGTLVVEKSLESVMLLASLAVLTLFVNLPPWLQTSSIVLSILMAALLVVLWAAARWPTRIIQWGQAVVARFPILSRWRVAERIIAAAESLRMFREPRIALRLLAWSVLAWGISIGTNALCLQAVGIRQPWYVPVLLMVVFYVGAALPSSPGRLGVFHYLAVETLAIFAVARTPALSFAIIVHFIAYILMGMIGAVCLWRENYGLQVKRGKAEAE